MSEEQSLIFNLELDISQAQSDIRRLETLLYRTIQLARRLGLPEDIEQQIVQLQRLILVIRMVHAAIMRLYMATGPIGWALGLVGLATAALTAGDFMTEVNSR